MRVQKGLLGGTLVGLIAVAIADHRAHVDISCECDGDGADDRGGDAVVLEPGNVNVPINAATMATDAFGGFNVHLRWDPSIFSLQFRERHGRHRHGRVLRASDQPTATRPAWSSACTSLTQVPPPRAQVAGDDHSDPGWGRGCSPLHLFTFGGADGGDSGTGRTR